MSEVNIYIVALFLVMSSALAFKVAWEAGHNDEPKIMRVSLALAVVLGVGGVILSFVPQIQIVFA